MPDDPHRDSAVQYAGAPLDQARLVVIAAHGRYGAPGDILKFADQVDVPGVAWLAPTAKGGSWWDASFLAPLTKNERGLMSAMKRMSGLIDTLMQQGFGPQQLVFTGFSQGACLVLEYVARHPRSYRGVVAMSGGLLGTSEDHGPPSEALYEHTPKRFEYPGDLTGLPIHLGCHAEDPLIPLARVAQSCDVLNAMGAQVKLTSQPGKMHGVLQSDLCALQDLLNDGPLV